MLLTVNTTKTEGVSQCPHWSTNVPPTLPAFTVGDEQLSVVPYFKYLGSIHAEDCGIDNDIQSCIKQASVAFGRLWRRVIHNKNLHPSTKASVYQAVCVITLLYSCEAWVTYSHHIRSLERFHISCLQHILGVTWWDRVTQTYQKNNCRIIEAMITQRQLKWLGHVISMPPCWLPRRVLYGQLHHGWRSAGGWRSYIRIRWRTPWRSVRSDPRTWRILLLTVPSSKSCEEMGFIWSRWRGQA